MIQKVTAKMSYAKITKGTKILFLVATQQGENVKKSSIVISRKEIFYPP